MKPIEIHLSDYKKPEFEFEQVYLYFKLDPEKTIVNSEIKIKRIVKNGNKHSALVLNGKELKLISLAINGVYWTNVNSKQIMICWKFPLIK